uniref:Uncharacterized protein n=2 Tax=Lepeophtheirus salmonis TaxID=72036 RepID=A0A0K2UAR4_LEPSM
MSCCGLQEHFRLVVSFHRLSSRKVDPSSTEKRLKRVVSPCIFPTFPSYHQPRKERGNKSEIFCQLKIYMFELKQYNKIFI